MARCAECGRTYDSALSFCPGCGSTRQAVDKGQTPPRQMQRRLQVRLAGAALAFLGFILVLTSGTGLLKADQLADGFVPVYADQPGGLVQVTVVRGNVPVAGALVEARQLQGDTFLNATTDPSGHASLTLRDHAGANVTVVADGREWSQAVLARKGETVDLRFDLDAAAGPAPRPVYDPKLVQEVQRYSAVTAAVGLVVVAGAMGALRLRAWKLSLAGAGAGLAVALYLLLAFPSIGLALLAAVFGISLLFIFRGRSEFP